MPHRPAITAFVDGYNLYFAAKSHAVKGLAKRDILLYDIKKLINRQLAKSEWAAPEESVSYDRIRFYTSAPLGGKQNEMHSSAIYKLWVDLLASFGVVVVEGRRQAVSPNKELRCDKCDSVLKRPMGGTKEKQTDVNIAVDLVCGATAGLKYRDGNGAYADGATYDKAVVVGGDTDLIPAIKCVLENGDGSVLVLIP